MNRSPSLSSRNVAPVFALTVALLVLGCPKKEEVAPPKTPAEPAATASASTSPSSAPATPRRKDMAITSASAEALTVFKEGRDHFENMRMADATVAFEKATRLDPAFALAYAYLGLITPVPGGPALAAKGRDLAAALPESERLLTGAVAISWEQGDPQALEHIRRLAEREPGDPHVHVLHARWSSMLRVWDEQIEALKKAISLAPDYAPLYNDIAYAYAFRGEMELALENGEKYVAMLPDEPNPHDTHGELLLMAGRLEEAEKAFTRALEIDPRFSFAWSGVALTRLLRGDGKGAEAAFVDGEKAGLRPIDRLFLRDDHAWAHMAMGTPMKTAPLLQQLEAESKKDGLTGIDGMLAVDRAQALFMQGQYEPSLAAAGEAATRVGREGVPGRIKERVDRLVPLARVWAQAKLGQSKKAEQSLAAVEAQAAKAKKDRLYQSYLQGARGAVAWTRGDTAQAIAELSACLDEDFFCRWQLALVQQEVGDVEAAKKTWGALARLNRRDFRYAVVRAWAIKSAP